MAYIYTGKKYSGSWTMQQHLQAVAAQTWTGIPGRGVLYSWGDNSNGQLGQNDTITRSSPVQVGSGTTWSSVSAGRSYNTAAIKTDGTLWTWGYNNNVGLNYGQLGQNNIVTRSSPVQVGSLTNWSTVSVGGGHTAAIKTDGTLWTWGVGSDGKLGQNNVVDRSSPVQVGALTNWLSVSAGSYHTAAIKTDGSLWVWGYGGYGALGQNNVVFRSSPVQVGALTNWSKVSAGGIFVAAIKTDGTLWTWGRNDSGQLGQNTNTPVSSPVQVGSGTTWSSVSSGITHTVAIKTDGTLWTWGYNVTYGALGLGDVANRSSPVQVGTLTDWSSVSSGYLFTLAIKTDGTLWSWGNNAGQLGQNDTVNRSSPVQVGSLNIWDSISSGITHTAAIAKIIT